MNKHSDAARAKRRWRATLWGVVAVFFLAVALPSAGYLFAQTSSGELPQRQFSEENETNPRSDMWGEARQAGEGYTAQTGPYVTDELMTNVGQNYRQVRTGPLMTIGGWILVGIFLAITVFYLLTGQKKIEPARSGQTVVRWQGYERFVHWTVALGFVLLAITGLSLLFGRTVLIPVFGHQGFAAYAELAYGTHNLVGPVFSVALVVMILLFIRDNIPNRTDLEWFRQGGGIVGNAHPSAGKANGGEKLWFWAGVCLLGVTVVISGLLALFPSLGVQSSREAVSWVLILHATAGVLWIGFFLGHAYIGTLGTEGALEGMVRGRVDTNWARQHHDLWYEEILAAGEKPVSEEELRARREQGPAGGEAPAGPPSS